jgi:hypothetical protein
MYNMRFKRCLLFVSMILSCVPSKIEAFWPEAMEIIVCGTLSSGIIIAYFNKDDIWRSYSESIATPTDAAEAHINQREIEYLVGIVSSDKTESKIAYTDFDICLKGAQEDMQQHKLARNCESYKQNMLQKVSQLQKNIRKYNNRLAGCAAYEKRQQVSKAVAQKEQSKVPEEQR